MSAQRKPPRTAANFNMPRTAAEFYPPRTAANFNMPRTAAEFYSPHTAANFNMPRSAADFHSHAARTAAVFRANQTHHTASSFIPTASEMNVPFRYPTAPKTSCEFDCYNPYIGNSEMAYTGTQFDGHRGAPRTGSMLWMNSDWFGGVHPEKPKPMYQMAGSTAQAAAMGAAIVGSTSLACDAGRYAMHSMRSGKVGYTGTDSRLDR